MNNVIELLDSILSARTVDAASMQVFDAIGLSAKHDSQIRNLAQYIAKTQPMLFDIDCSAAGTQTMTINSEQFCIVTVQTASVGKLVTVQFVSRNVWNARAYTVADGLTTNWSCLLSNNTVTISGVTANSITIQIL